MRKHAFSLATALATAAAVAALAGGAADAAPAPADSSIAYTAGVTDGAVVLTTASGSMDAVGNRLEIRDAGGRLAAGVPLSYVRDGKVWPIAADVHGNVAKLRPNTAQPIDVHDGVDGVAVFNNALGIATTEISLAVTVGSLLGTIVGAPAGCIAGVVAGSALVAPLFLPGAAGGCVAGLVAGIALGAAAGTVILGAPVSIAAAIQFFNNLAAGEAKH